MSKLKLCQFDLFGTFRLTKDETAGIKDLVQKLGDDEYLSRNANYYPTKAGGSTRRFDEACTEYERLNDLLPMSGKPAFVVCEKMHELATRAVNTIQQKHKLHLFQDGRHFDTVAQKCAQECADNLVRLIHGQPAPRTATQLCEETRLSPETLLGNYIVEADNKKQLYMCANALPDDAEHLITPGRGSSKLGTLVQAVRQHKGLKPLNFTQIYYSLYDNKQNGKVFSKYPGNLSEKLLVMDDDIDTGRTLINIKAELTTQGHQVTSGGMNTLFDAGVYNGKSIFQEPDWANYIDIIPNQYVWYDNQVDLKDCLKKGSVRNLTNLLNDACNHNGWFYKTADYFAMRDAEKMANKLGADLYQVSDKISPAAVDYNTKFRAQIEQYNTEFQNSLNI